jgi:single-strand DNA-binding protein
MNNINLVGHIAQDITIKENHVSLKIGLKRNYKDAEGNYNADFVWVTAFKQTAKYIKEYISKGDLVAIHGHFYSSDKKNEDGKYMPASVIIDSITRLRKANTPNPNESPF